MITYPTARSAIKMMRLDNIIKHGKSHSFKVEDIAKMFNIKPRTAEDYIKILRRNKEIYICGYERTKAALRYVYKTGDKPDAPKLDRLTQKEYTARYKKKLDRLPPPKPVVIIKRDVAASWF